MSRCLWVLVGSMALATIGCQAGPRTTIAPDFDAGAVSTYAWDPAGNLELGVVPQNAAAIDAAEVDAPTPTATAAPETQPQPETTIASAPPRPTPEVEAPAPLKNPFIQIGLFRALGGGWDNGPSDIAGAAGIQPRLPPASAGPCGFKKERPSFSRPDRQNAR